MENRNINITITPGTVFRVVFIVLMFIFLFYIKDVVLIVLTAIVIASAVEPLVAWFKKIKITRLPAVIISYFIFGIFFVGVFYFFVPSLIKDTVNFLNSVPNYIDTISVWNPLGENSLAPEKEVARTLSADINTGASLVRGVAPNLIDAPNTTQKFSLIDTLHRVNNTFSNISAGALNLMSLIFGGFFGFLLIVVLSFYLSVQEDGIAKFLRIITPSASENYVINLWRRVQVKIGLWFQGQLLLGLVVGVLVYLGLIVFGVKNALFLAVLAGVFEVIPIFGPILSAIPAVAIAYTDGGLVKSLIMVGFYTIVQQFENHLIYPLVVKKIVGVPPILVIIALIVGGKLAGFLGIFLSVPLAAVLVEYIDDIQKSKLKSS